MATGSWEQYFGSRRWRVASEVTGAEEVPGAVVAFVGGKFGIESTGEDRGVFHSPLSSARGTKGVLLQEVDQQGTDIAGSRIAVGIVVFRKARREGAVT